MLSEDTQELAGREGLLEVLLSGRTNETFEVAVELMIVAELQQ